MATATLTFDLHDPDDIMAHKRAVKSLDMTLALWEIVYNTKKGIGYQLEGKGGDGKDYDAFDALDLVYEKIYEILDENNIDIDELIN